MLYIGVDLGTSAVKLLLMNHEGKILNIITREYPIFFPKPGWSEQNPQDWINEVVTGIRQLVACFPREQIDGIAVAGQMHGLVVLDEKDQILRPAILWNDGRTSEETEFLNQEIGKERISKLTANIAFAGFTAPKLLWMRKHEPELFNRIHKIMLPKDYVNYMLTGIHCTDVSDASGMLMFDVEKKCWSKEMLDICSVREEQMAQIFESCQCVGTLKPELAKELDLSEKVRVAAGAGDNAAAAVGTATVGDGQCNISVGTSGTIFISSRDFGVDSNNALHAFAHADGHYHLMGCMLSAASCNKWWNGDVLQTSDYKSEESKILSEDLGNNRVFFLPYLMGERSPHNDPDARGAFINLSLDSERKDLSQAMLEGVAFGMRDCLEVARSLGLDIRKSKICGGGAKSILWRQIFANVLNIEIQTVETQEGPGYGAAILAAVACGAFSSVEEACNELIRVRNSISPEPELVARYEIQYRKFQKIYPALRNLFPVLQ